MNKSDLVAIRDYEPGDRNFILATWLRGLYYGDSWFREIPKDIFMENYHRVVTHILDSPGNQVKVACLKDDTDVILGYAVQSSALPVVHWVFVKAAWRGIGIGRNLFPASTEAVTHLTKVGLNILHKAPGVKFNPFLV